MKTNMGTADRILRILVAVAIAVLYFTGVISATLGLILMILAAVFILTAFMSFCPLYLPFGLSTAKKKD